MYISDGYVCGGLSQDMIKIIESKPLNDRMILLTFSSGEKRLFDSSVLVGDAFAPLNDPEVFNNISLDHGVVTWMNGEIDCSPEFMYSNSYEYGDFYLGNYKTS